MDTTKLLAEFARNKSEEAFSRIVAAHIDFVYSVALRQGCDAELAQDVAQIVFIKLARNASRLRANLPLDTWLFTVTRNAAINSIRQRDRRRQHEQKAAAMADSQTNPSSGHDIDSIAKTLNDALAQLKEPDRNLIILRYVRNLPLREIGDNLGLSENTAGKRIARAIEKLRAIMLRKNVAIPATAITASLAGFAVVSAPKALAGAVAHSAILAAHSNIAATLGGWLMLTTKMKIAAIVAVILIIIVPTSIIAVRSSMSSPAPTAAPSPRIAGPVEAKFAPVFDPLAHVPFYSLAPGQVLKRVDAPPEARRAMYLATHQIPTDVNQLDVFPELNGAMMIEWDKDQPSLVGLFNRPNIPMDSFILTRLREFPQDVEGDLKDISITGDFALRKGATPDEIRQAMQDILQNDLKQNVTLTYREVSRPVIVLRGKWNFQPIDRGVAAAVNPDIQFYGTTLNTDPNMGPNGFCASPKDLAGFLGEWIGKTIIIEAEGVPQVTGWQGNGEEDDLPNGNRKAHDQTLVLNHITEQTGLTWSQETRTVRRLFIEKGNKETAASDVPAEYRLADGEALKQVGPPAPKGRSAFYFAHAPGIPDHEPASLVVEWNQDKAILWGDTDSPYKLKDLLCLRQSLGVREWEIEGSPSLLELPLPGDFSFDHNATKEQYQASVEKVASQALQRKVTLEFRDVDVPVLVLKGKWQYTPVKERETETGSPVVELYASNLIVNPGGEGAGTLDETAEAISDYLERTVVFECTDAPAQIRIDRTANSEQEEAQRLANPATAIGHIEQQTGLKAVEETRKIWRLYVDQSK